MLDFIVNLGGIGSGFKGHKGRPGKRGGSLPNGASSQPVTDSEKDLVSQMKLIDDITKGRSIESFVLKHGQFYEPQPLPKGIKKGQPKLCYMNAYNLARTNDEYTYVEGFAVPDFMPLPIQHAWVVDKEGNVIDNTWKTPGVAYYGVPLDIDDVSDIISESETYGVLKMHNPAFRKYVEGLNKPEFGGSGSGNYGHKGRPGKVGGSSKSSSRTIISDDATQDDPDFLFERKKKQVISDPVKAAIAEVLEDSFDKIERMNVDDDPEIGSYSIEVADNLDRESLVVTATMVEGEMFEVGGRNFKTGGQYNADNREIVIYRADKINENEMKDILYHEIQHDRFNYFKDEANKQASEIFKKNKYGKKRITDNDGNLINEKDKKKYWAYNIHQTYLDGPLSKVLAARDGVSKYSEAYWRDYSTSSDGSMFTEGIKFERAVDETLAEISRIDSGSYWTGDRTPKEIDMVWRMLYRDINNAGR